MKSFWIWSVFALVFLYHPKNCASVLAWA